MAVGYYMWNTWVHSKLLREVGYFGVGLNVGLNAGLHKVPNSITCLN